MAYISLFKNCIFHGDYKEVLNKEDYVNVTQGGQTITNRSIDMYLDGLFSQLNFSITEDVYLTNKGSFSFEITEELTIDKSYNYMRIINTINGVTERKYYFVESVTLIDNMLVVNYSEDIWQNYDFKIAYGKRTRLYDFKKSNTIDNDYTLDHTLDIVHNLPIPYESNKPLILTKQNVTDYHVIVTIQAYTTNTAGTNITERKVFTFCLGKNDVTSMGLTDIWIEDFVKHQSDMKIIASASGITGEYSYSISNIYLVPDNFGLVINSTKIYALGTTNYGLYYIQHNYSGSIIEGTEFEFNNDFKIKSIGLLGHNIEINPNGKKIKVKPIFSLDNYTFAIMLNICGEVIDVSKDLEVQVPISAQSYETSETLKYEQNTALISSGLSLIGNVLKSAMKMQIPDISGAGNTIMGEVKNLLPIHSTSQSVKIENQSAYLNAFNGIVTWSLNPDNEEEVAKASDIEGYTIQEYVGFNPKNPNLNHYDSSMNKYDIVKYENLVIDGVISESIRKQLEEIFKNGIRYYYFYNRCRSV
jgi:hypothetical protein